MKAIWEDSYGAMPDQTDPSLQLIPEKEVRRIQKTHRIMSTRVNGRYLELTLVRKPYPTIKDNKNTQK
jgi:hypothetical protein